MGKSGQKNDYTIFVIFISKSIKIKYQTRLNDQLSRQDMLWRSVFIAV